MDQHQFSTDSVRNTSLYEAVRGYVVAAIEFARPHGEQFPVLDQSEGPPIPFSFFEKELSSLPEYEACRNELSRDKAVSSHLNRLVGTSSHASQSFGLNALMLQVPQLGIYRGKILFHPAFFDREYMRFENAFYSDGFEFEAIAPLLGIRFERPIRLAPSLEVQLLNAFDFTIPIEEKVDQDSIYPPFIWAVRTTYQLKKRFESIDREAWLFSVAVDESVRMDANQRIDTVITAIRLLQGTHVFSPRKLHRTRSWFFEDSRDYDLRFVSDSPYTLDTGEQFENALIEIWTFLTDERVIKEKYIVVATKRFSYAHERVDWEDKIVDLLIAAEALFLPNSIQSELKFRLRLNAAIYLSEFFPKQQIFDDMGFAYDLRSSIVHGGDPESLVEKIRKREVDRFGDDFKFLQFTVRISEYIRIALIKMMRHVANTPSDPQIDWEKLLLGSVANVDGGNSAKDASAHTKS